MHSLLTCTFLFRPASILTFITIHSFFTTLRLLCAFFSRGMNWLDLLTTGFQCFVHKVFRFHFSISSIHFGWNFFCSPDVGRMRATDQENFPGMHDVCGRKRERTLKIHKFLSYIFLLRPECIYCTHSSLHCLSHLARSSCHPSVFFPIVFGSPFPGKIVL